MIEQGTAAWFASRVGKLTASRMADAMAKTKTGYGASRANLMAEIVVERLTGQKTEGFTNSAMQHGIDTEPHARAAYEFHSDNAVELIGFVDHSRIAMFGASPDGLVGSNGLLEIKCPGSAAHIDVLLRGVIPGKYQTQMATQLACTGREWCDFVSFDPRLPEEMRLFVQRFYRDASQIAEIEREAETFLGEVEDTINRLRNKYAEAA
jgi:putative phage-type endonuclease